MCPNRTKDTKKSRRDWRISRLENIAQTISESWTEALLLKEFHFRPTEEGDLQRITTGYEILTVSGHTRRTRWRDEETQEMVNQWVRQMVTLID